MANKKILHLVCNSHLDPVWQWDWDEGASAALATFYAACNLLDKYDFIFCHNEVLLYEYIEKYDPELFARIQGLVKLGKWKIMGGWYCQPDCMVPSGESFIRQISLGREFFKDKFDKVPTDAVNFDAFAHTRGIASICAKSGFESYTFCRPMEWYPNITKKTVPHGPFLWKGYDGKTIKALRVEDLTIYCSSYGQAKESIERKYSHYLDQDISMALWGVGNHGGVSSEKDYEDIMVLKNEKKGEVEIIHSTLEEYFKSVNPKTVFDEEFITFIKSYSSVNAIKLAHDQLENALYFTEKVCTLADLYGKYSYNKEVLKNAERTLCQIEFHDVLSGTAIKTGTDASIRKAYGAIESLKGEMFAAFVAIVKDLPRVTPRDDNIVVLNPYPYEFNDYIETEFFIEDGRGYLEKEHYVLTLYDKDGNEIPHQVVFEEGNVNMDRRKHVIFKVKVPPCSAVSVGVRKSLAETTKTKKVVNGDIVIKDKVKEVKISSKSGLISSFKVNGVEYLTNESFAPICFNDNEDPWGWNIDHLADKYGTNTLPLKTGKLFYKPFKLDNSSKGVFEGITGIHFCETGELYTEVECCFSKGESHIVMVYKFYKDTPYFDVKIHTLWNEHGKGLKLKVATNGLSSFFGQAAFGIEKYKNNNFEYPVNRYVYSKNDDNVLSIYNKSGIHSAAKKGKNLYLTLLNGSLYCCHPLGPSDDVVHDRARFQGYIEQGVHDFYLRVRVNKENECEKYSKEYNEPVYSVSYFPHGDGNVSKNAVELTNSNIVVSALKRLNNGNYMIRLYNGSFTKTETTLKILGISKTIIFKKFEFKTFIYNKKSIIESKDCSIY